MSNTFSLRSSWNLQWKILTLKATREELLNLKPELLLWGVPVTLMAGIGRAWDNPAEELLIRSGLPSVAYIFVLSAFLYFFIALLRPKNWSYRRLLILVSMTALPGLLYAIPLEMILKPGDAAAGNTILLFIVAVWRVVILGSFLAKTTDMRFTHLVVALFLPLFLIINLLITQEKFEKTFSAMGGIRKYLVVSDKEAFSKWKESEDAERKRAAERGEAYIPSYSTPLPYQTDNKKMGETIYLQGGFREDSPIPPGLREIPWDDPHYLPPSPVMFLIRPLGTVSWYAAPVLLIYYVGVVIGGIIERIKQRRNSKRSDADKLE